MVISLFLTFCKSSWYKKLQKLSDIKSCKNKAVWVVNSQFLVTGEKKDKKEDDVDMSDGK